MNVEMWNVCVYMRVCVCALVYATLRGPNVPTKIVKPEFFANRSSVRGRFGIMVGLGDRKYNLVSVKLIEVYGKSPQFTETHTHTHTHTHTQIYAKKKKKRKEKKSWFWLHFLFFFF